MPTPTDITYHKDDRLLVVTFDDGQSFRLPAELLRVESPSAEVQGHHPSQKVLIAGRMHVSIIGIEPVGNYAIRLQFDDLHHTGIYTWDYLYELGQTQDQVWATYLANLAAKGLKREPR